MYFLLVATVVRYSSLVVGTTTTVTQLARARERPWPWLAANLQRALVSHRADEPCSGRGIHLRTLDRIRRIVRVRATAAALSGDDMEQGPAVLLESIVTTQQAWQPLSSTPPGYRNPAHLKDTDPQICHWRCFGARWCAVYRSSHKSPISRMICVESRVKGRCRCGEVVQYILAYRTQRLPIPVHRGYLQISRWRCVHT